MKIIWGYNARVLVVCVTEAKALFGGVRIIHASNDDSLGLPIH